VLIRHGLGVFVPRSEAPQLGDGPRQLQSTPERATAAIQELGPTFVKLGQVLSTRPDLVPDEYVHAFEQLQDDVTPLPWPQIEAQLNAELGPQWRDLLSDFDETPLATASIAQVHRGTLLDGRQVVLKVQRPDIEKTISADLNILFFLARRLLIEWPEARSGDPIGVLTEFQRSIMSELNFTSEAANMARFAQMFAHDEGIFVPAVIDVLTTERVLCMEFLDGVKLRRAREAGCDMDVVGERYLRAAYDMLFIHGFFHGDLHPGNVIVLPGNVVGLIDMGMVGKLNAEMRNNVISIMFALQRGDFRTIARLFYEIAIKDERVDYRAVENDTMEVMEAHWSTGGSVADMQMGPFVMDLAMRAGRHGARVPSAYTMFFKAILTSEGLAKSLITEVDPISAVQPYFERMMRERMSPDRLEQDAFYALLTMSSLAARLPVLVTQLVDDLDQQRFKVAVDFNVDDRELANRNTLLNRLIATTFTVTAFLCGTMLVAGSDFDASNMAPLVLAAGFYVFGTGAFFVTTVMALRNRG